ncbi:MAG: pimeloyl-ACP methyl ester carboxylesterase [Phenylobacterium sp.]|jgi:pimeloyl-ACP methyl ester carboxylesterase
MSAFIPWSSQPLDAWASKHAKGQFIDINGHKTHYIEKGAGEPLILLHGFFYDSYLWNANIDALAEKFKVYVVDLWGCGYSTRASLDYGYALYVEQIIGFMDRLGIENASFLGQSMGGGTAMKLCTEHRDRVNKLLLVDAAGLPNPIPALGKFFNLPVIGEFFLNLKTDAIRKAGLFGSFIHNKALVSDEYFDNVVRAHKIENTATVGLSIQRKQFFDKLSDEIALLAKIEVPILIVWGAQDKAIPLQVGQQLHQLLSGSRFEVLDNAGHVPNFESAAKFNQLAITFLQEP